MGPVRLVAQAGLVSLFLLGFCHGMVNARGGEWHAHYRVSRDPSVGYAVPIQRVYQFPAAVVFQPTAAYGYAVPIQHVYQFPAAMVFQPGPELPFQAMPGPWYDQYGGPSFVPR
jgi:hypothetical protein